MKPHTRGHLRTWGTLLLLLGLTVGSAFLDLGPWNGVVNLAIAAVKATWVAVFFMHLLRAPVLLRLAALVPPAILAILFALTQGDYATRTLERAPWQTPPADS